MKTTCTFLPLAAILRKINTTSFRFYFIYPLCCKTTPSSLVLLCKKWFISLYDILVDIASFHSYRLVTTAGAGVGWRNGGTVNRKRRKANGSDLVVQLAVDCNREVNICYQNSWGRFIDFKLSVCARFLPSLVGFVTQKWLQWVSKCHKSAILSDRIAIPKTLMVQGIENLLPLKFWWKSTYPSVRFFFGDGGQNGPKCPEPCRKTRK